MLEMSEPLPSVVGSGVIGMERDLRMPQVELDRPAPDFTLADYHGQEVSLSRFKGHQPVLLVFNRGFM